MAQRQKSVDRYVDRGEVIQGINSTIRDNRAPYRLARKIENFCIPDGRLERRPGYSSLIQSVDGNTTEFISDVMLAKHTPVSGQIWEDRYPLADYDVERETTKNQPGRYYRTPFSYGLIRWHEDIQPTHASDWSMEFIFRVGAEERLVTDPIARVAPADYSGTVSYTGPFDSMRGPLDGNNEPICKGVYLYDQTVLANIVRYRTGNSGSGSLRDPIRGFGGVFPQLYYTKGISALSVGYRKGDAGDLLVFLYWSMLDDTTDYAYHEYAITVEGLPYAEGDLYHVAVTHDASTRTVTLYLVDDEGTTYSDSLTYASGLEWAGVNDHLNDGTAVADFANRSTRAIERDIVILNEHTARGGYSSTCKSGSTWEALDRYTPNPNRLATDGHPSDAWACSPPQGTAIAEIRFWSELRSSSEIADNSFTRIVDAPSDELDENLVGYWPCNDGSKVCRDLAGNNHMTVHRGPAPYVNDSGLLKEGGLKFGDNQFLTLELFAPLQGDYIEDLYTNFRRLFKCRRPTDPFKTGDAYSHTTFDEQQDFTVQMQIRTPLNFQQDLAEVYLYAGGSGATTSRPGEGDPTTTDSNQQMMDGYGDSMAAIETDHKQLPFQQTLFSVEASVSRPSELSEAFDELGMGSLPRNIAVPITRAYLGPKQSNGKCKVYFEFFCNSKDGSDNIVPRIETVNSNTTELDPNTVYTITLVKRTTMGMTSTAGAVYSSGVAGYNATGTRIEIWINDTRVNTTTFSYDSSAMRHEPSYCLNIGASFVNNVLDRSQAAATSAASTAYNGVVLETTHAMNPWQDAVAFYTLGFFRMWETALEEDVIGKFYNTSIDSYEKESTLLLNIELDEPMGERVPNQARYDVEFISRSKDHLVGVPAYGTGGLADKSARADLTFKDCLGYIAAPPHFSFRSWPRPSCQLIMPYRKASSAYSYGVLYVFKGAVLRDTGASGELHTVFLPSIGQMNDYATDEKWRYENIGNRAFLFSKGGSPKVFDGSFLSTVGLDDRWEPTTWYCAPIHQALAADEDQEVGFTPEGDFKYVGVVVAYVSEKYNLVTYAKREVVRIQDTTYTVSRCNPYALNLQPHPDARVTNIYVYVTYPQTNETAAYTAPAYLTESQPLRNYLHGSLVTTFNESTGYIESPMDINLTRRPDYDYAAQLNGQLYVVGKNSPDTIYRSFIAAPQQFDTVRTQITLDEGVGDRINGLVSAFGAVFAFRGASTWRIDPLDTQDAQVTKINNIGAASPDSTLLISLPDQGSPVIFVWSAYGPYLFDGGIFNYIGYGVEDSETHDSYGWLESSSVMCLDYPDRREVLIFYKSVDSSGVVSDYYDKVLVYNYRFNSWYTYTGINAVVGATMALGVRGAGSTSIGQPAELVGSGQSKLLLLGSDCGKVFEFGASSYDGFEDLHTDVIAAFDGTDTITLTTGLSADLVGLECYIKFINSGSFDGWDSARVISYNSATKELKLQDNFGGSYGAIAATLPVAGDEVQLGIPVTQVEFPWDQMDRPFYDKKVTNVIFWTDGAFYSRLYRNWDSTLVSGWVTNADADGKRVRHYYDQSGFGEAFKLQLVGFGLDSRLDAYAYQVVDDMRGVTVQ